MGALWDWLGRRRSGRTLKIPPRGRAYVVSDLHGHWDDWRAFRQRTRVLERIGAGEDLWLLLTGDVPDVARHRAIDASVPDDGDVRIVDELLAARTELGGRAERIVYLEGNHDFHLQRICREVAAWHADRPASGAREQPALTLEQYRGYCEDYRRRHGERIFANNVVPYDMAARARSEHIDLLCSGPILAQLGATGVLVTHAGPPRMDQVAPVELKRQIDGASAADLDGAAPDAYYGSAYHQLLNNRFRNGDYGLADLERFLEVYGSSLLVTGHTPHPYLVDFARRGPLAGCAFRDGLGLIGGRQVVLCTSFGAFAPAQKRFLELDLARPYPDVDALFAADAVRPLYTAEECATSSAAPLPGADIVLGPCPAAAEEVEGGAPEPAVPGGW